MWNFASCKKASTADFCRLSYIWHHFPAKWLLPALVSQTETTDLMKPKPHFTALSQLRLLCTLNYWHIEQVFFLLGSSTCKYSIAIYTAMPGFNLGGEEAKQGNSILILKITDSLQTESSNENITSALLLS